MLKTVFSIRSIQMATIVNMIIFYAQKIPILNKLITSKLYAQFRIKRWLSIIAIPLSLIWQLVIQLFYYGLAIFLPIQLLGAELTNNEKLVYFYFIFFVFTFVTGAVSSATILEPKRKKYVAIKLFRMNPSDYMKATLLTRYLTFFIFAVPVMLWFTLPLGATVWHVFFLLITATLWRIFSEWVHLQLYKKMQLILIKKVGIVWAIIGISCLLAYGVLIVGIVPTFVTSTIFSIVLSMMGLLGGWACLTLVRYKNYRLVTDAATNYDDPLLDLGKMVTDQQQSGVTLQADDLQLQMTNPKTKRKLEQLSGFEYLNKIFHLRHHKFLRQPLQKKLAGIVIFGMVIIGLTFIIPQQLASNDLFNGRHFSYLFLLLYFLFMSEKTCRAYFYNCDISLLRYSFYRKAAPEHFRIRLRFIIQQNLLIALLFSFVLTTYFTLLNVDFLSSGALHLVVSILSLALFFSIHDLFMYYIFQPYSTDKNVRNPLYQVFSFFVSGLGGIFLVIRLDSFSFASICLGLAFIYSIIAPILVKKYAIRTFRIK
ncbi:hypothetical protein ACFSTH_01855 [Paenibacillus yanchengensis]|uniref:ABC transporter permease n=1 Tax=Paenibacillus yanchengensis TaxID=2035833 RepID=A0ABW4YR00_9BACL